MKRCRDCKTEKPYNEFSRRRSSPDGHEHHCKDCLKVRRATWGKIGRVRHIPCFYGEVALVDRAKLVERLLSVSCVVTRGRAAGILWWDIVEHVPSDAYMAEIKAMSDDIAEYGAMDVQDTDRLFWALLRVGYDKNHAISRSRQEGFRAIDKDGDKGPESNHGIYAEPSSKLGAILPVMRRRGRGNRGQGGNAIKA